MALARLSRLKALLNISASTFDDDLKLLLADATAEAERFTGRVLESATQTDELYAGDGSRALYLRQYPATSITAVKIWNGSSFATETAANYELQDGVLLYYPAPGYESAATYGAWPRGYGVNRNIKVTYVAGYATTNWATDAITTAFAVPRDLESAVARMAALLWADTRKDQARLGVQSLSKSVEMLTVERYQNGWPPDIEATLKQYRRASF